MTQQWGVTMVLRAVRGCVCKPFVWVPLTPITPGGGLSSLPFLHGKTEKGLAPGLDSHRTRCQAAQCLAQCARQGGGVKATFLGSWSSHCSPAPSHSARAPHLSSNARFSSNPLSAEWELTQLSGSLTRKIGKQVPKTVFKNSQCHGLQAMRLQVEGHGQSPGW